MKKIIRVNSTPISNREPIDHREAIEQRSVRVRGGHKRGDLYSIKNNKNIKPGGLDTTDTHTPTPEMPRRTSLVRNLRRPWAPREHPRESTEKSTTDPPCVVTPAMCRQLGHAILCRQGKRGRGALPQTYVSVVTVSSLGGKGEAKNI